jgi:hypothetical protein
LRRTSLLWRRVSAIDFLKMLEAERTTVAPTMRLSPRGLTIALLSMAGVGLSVYAMFPDSVGGPPLPVAVALDRQPIETTGGQGALLTEVVVVENKAEHEITRLSIEINGQYLLFQNSPLAVAEKLILPQRVFTDKRSSQRFNPAKYDVEEIVVTGQLPSGARGVSKFEFSE